MANHAARRKRLKKQEDTYYLAGPQGPQGPQGDRGLPGKDIDLVSLRRTIQAMIRQELKEYQCVVTKEDLYNNTVTVNMVPKSEATRESLLAAVRKQTEVELAKQRSPGGMLNRYDRGRF